MEHNVLKSRDTRLSSVVGHHCLEVSRFVGIGEVVDHHRLNFLVINE